MNTNSRFFILIAALFAVSSVGLGAIGAHSLELNTLDNHYLSAFNKAVDYSIHNSLALLGISLLCHCFNQQRFYLAGYTIALGAFIFQSTLFIYSMTAIKSITILTPVGGILMILGWLGLGITALLAKK